MIRSFKFLRSSAFIVTPSKSLTTTATCLDKYTALSGAPRNLQKMIRSEMRKQEKQRKSFSSKPKKLNFCDTAKAQTFNKMFHENVNIVLTSANIKEKLNSYPVHITKVRVASNFEQVYIYWTTTMPNFEHCQELEKLLDSAAPDIRFEIQQYALIGRIPRLLFLKENQISVETALQKLMNACKEVQAQEADEKVQIDSGVELKTDVLISREKILKGVLERLEHSEAKHRTLVSDDGSFTQHP